MFLSRSWLSTSYFKSKCLRKNVIDIFQEDLNQKLNIITRALD